MPRSVAGGSLPEASPFQLSSPLFTQRTLDANTPGTGRRGDNWDMITANETGVDAGRYLFSPFENNMSGVKRFDRLTDTSLTVAKDADRDGIAESIGRWASMSTINAEPTGLYFDKFNHNIAYVNIQHAGSDVDRMILISAVPEAKPNAMMLAGLVLMGAMVCRRKFPSNY